MPRADHVAVDPLAGWTVCVTADRRADEQAEMLPRPRRKCHVGADDRH